MDHSKIYDKYNSDSGDKDLSTEKIMPVSFTFDDVLNYAIQLGAIMIVKVNNRFYLKGLHHKFSYDEVKERIEENMKHNKFKTRKCYLIRYC
jgi:hypothetical protein